MITKDIQTINGKTLKGIEIQLTNAPLVMVLGTKGYIMCGYLNLATAVKMGDSAAMVKGVRTIDDLLSALIVDATPEAIKAGIKPGMTGLEAIDLIA